MLNLYQIDKFALINYDQMLNIIKINSVILEPHWLKIPNEPLNFMDHE